MVRRCTANFKSVNISVPTSKSRIQVIPCSRPMLYSSVGAGLSVCLFDCEQDYAKSAQSFFLRPGSSTATGIID